MANSRKKQVYPELAPISITEVVDKRFNKLLTDIARVKGVDKGPHKWGTAKSLEDARGLVLELQPSLVSEEPTFTKLVIFIQQLHAERGNLQEFAAMDTKPNSMALYFDIE